MQKNSKKCLPCAVDRDNLLEIDPFYLYHPSTRQDLQSLPSLFALTLISPSHSPVLIDDQYLIRVNSTKDPNVITYTVFMYLPHDMDYKLTVRTVLAHQLTHMQTAGLPTSLEGLNTLQVTDNSTYLVWPELDDEPIITTIQVIPHPRLISVPTPLP
jgi:hypothetical protein